MTEVSTYSFVGDDILNKTGVNEDRELRLSNPLSLELDRLRRSLVPNMLKSIKYNQRYNESFALYEVGRIYRKENRKSEDLISEERFVCGAFYRKDPDDDLFYYAKNAAAGLLNTLRVSNLSAVPINDNLKPYMHPGRTLALQIKGKQAGYIFELNPKIYKNFDINGKAALFEINLDIMFNIEKSETVFNELQKFPDVPFEISVLADKFTYVKDISTIIEKSSKEYINKIEVISIYQGAPIPEDMKSVSFRIIFNAKDATLTPEQIDKLQKGVVENLKKNGYKLR